MSNRSARVPIGAEGFFYYYNILFNICQIKSAYGEPIGPRSVEELRWEPIGLSGKSRRICRRHQKSRNFCIWVPDRKIGPTPPWAARRTPTLIIPQVGPVVNRYFQQKNRSIKSDFRQSFCSLRQGSSAGCNPSKPCPHPRRCHNRHQCRALECLLHNVDCGHSPHKRNLYMP